MIKHYHYFNTVLSKTSERGTVSIMSLKNLLDVPKEEQEKFLKSFDQVLLDLDGVVWIVFDPITGALESVKNLKKLGKQIHYVTNNSMLYENYLLKILNNHNFPGTIDDIVTPIQIAVGYLKSLKYVNEEIFVIGLPPIKEGLKKAGFNVLPDPPSTIDVTVEALLAENDVDKRNVKAVILDVDTNLTYIKLQKAYWYLLNPNCIWIVTLKDKLSPMGPKGPVLGSYHNIECLKDLTGKEYTSVAKPSTACVNYIKEKYKVTDPKKVLFIGDSIESDMSTAAMAGFQKLLVLSGTAQLKDVNNWKYPEDYKPEYYVENLEVLNKIIKAVFKEFLVSPFLFSYGPINCISEPLLKNECTKIKFVDMATLKNLAGVSRAEKEKFLNSFDQVLLDLDGVLWYVYNAFPGASECVNNLIKLGKKAHYVTNTSSLHEEKLLKRLNDKNFPATIENLVTPKQTLISYLETKNMNDKEIFVIGLQSIKDGLTKAGFKLVPDPPFPIEETIEAILSHNDTDTRQVGAVVIDVDINFSYVKLQKAFWYLQNPNCELIVTLKDKIAPMGPKGPLIGMLFVMESLKDLIGRDYVEIAKPSKTCTNYTIKKFNITDPNRILFIGDSIFADMGTAAMGGFQKLLVLSGSATIEDIKNWQYSEDLKPEYYIQDLAALNVIIKSIFPNLVD
ncbi:uncharacterized protein LOC130895763 [Diorhabda carinulata]|uniref:uncharacterized protein LOC130895763 n=1 Tax=Diorhabda carinulata TaxID=1163345 RepID=UPI0025A0961D|nr:uncharacterized protein LOC130895763 [Diorhabda carinulata]